MALNDYEEARGKPVSTEQMGEKTPYYEEPKKKIRQEIVTEDTIRMAYDRLKKYQAGKQNIDEKATASQEWWRGRHWSQIQKRNNSLKDDNKPASAWLFNSIINKLADMMDNFPKPNVLPREADDIEDAKALGEIVPVILEQNHYEDLYRSKALDYIGDGTAITCVLWDSTKHEGLGDITINQVDIHNFFWKPGISDIQESPEVFVIAPIHDDELLAIYPEMEGHTGKDFTKTEYVHDDSIDTSDLSYIVDWYYKQTIREEVPVGADGETVPRIKTILHYCKFCNDVVLYSSENEGEEKGFYWHGKFPFVFQKNFPVKDSPCGFGYIDVMKDPQTYIDALDQMILKNAFMSSSPRFWIRENSSFNAEQFADWSKPFVTFSGNSLEEEIRAIDIPSMPGFVVNHLVNKVDELKETSGNRDFSQGSAAAGVTAASAIAALQEAGSKLARLLNKGAYSAFAQECYLIIELIRQFYCEPRSFRIDDGQGGFMFIEYSNMNITDDEAMLLGLVPVDSYQERRRPIFDIQVVPEKSSPFSRAAQNETAKEMYGMGMFNPDMAEPTLVAMDMMDFEGKDDIKQKIQQNSAMLQQFQQMAQRLQELDMMLPGMGIAQSVGLAPMGQQAGMPLQGEEQAAGQVSQQAGPQKSGTPEERAARIKTDSTMAAKARLKAADQASLK